MSMKMTTIIRNGMIKFQCEIYHKTIIGKVWVYTNTCIGLMAFSRWYLVCPMEHGISDNYQCVYNEDNKNYERDGW